MNPALTYHFVSQACPERSRRDPQLGRPALSVVEVWFAPDPAEQFHNPYLAMGNNPVMYVDPDGEWIDLAANLIWGGVLGGIQAEQNGGSFLSGFAFGMASGGIGMGVGALGLSPLGSSALSGAATIGAAGLMNSIAPGTVNTDALTKAALLSTAMGGFAEFSNNNRNSQDNTIDGNVVDLPTLDIQSDGNYFIHKVDSRLKVARGIQRAQTGQANGFNRAFDFSPAQRAWIKAGMKHTFASLEPKQLLMLGLSGIMAGGMGGNLSAGFIIDLDNGFDVYGYLGAGPAYGVDLSGNINMGVVTSTMPSGAGFSPYDLSGWGTQHNFGVGIYDFSTGVNELYQTVGFGVSTIGPKLGYSNTVNYTWVRRLTKH